MENNCIRIGMKAPDFSAATTFGPIKLSDYQGKWVVLFSHPGDFTPVCTTEFLAFSKAQPQFEARGAQLLGLSIDSNPSHLAWVYAIYVATGVQVPFPIIADRTGEIARLYGMMAPDVSRQETVRNVFFIDPEQTIRAILVYPLTNGRSIPEILRLLSAYPVERCCYGHLHGYAIKRRLEGGWNGTDFSLISADYLGFVPKKICE